MAREEKKTLFSTPVSPRTRVIHPNMNHTCTITVGPQITTELCKYIHMWLYMLNCSQEHLQD